MKNCIYGLLLLLLITGCSKEKSEVDPHYSKIPEIKLISLELVDDPTFEGVKDMKIKFHFQDGDGNKNLGLGDADTSAPFNWYNCVKPDSCVKNPNFTNLKCKFYVFDPIKNAYNLFALNGDSTLFYGRFPKITSIKEGSDIPFIINPLTNYEGEMTYIIQSASWNSYKTRTIRFSISILDRDLNESNLIVTDSLFVK